MSYSRAEALFSALRARRSPLRDAVRDALKGVQRALKREAWADQPFNGTPWMMPTWMGAVGVPPSPPGGNLMAPPTAWTRPWRSRPRRNGPAHGHFDKGDQESIEAATREDKSTSAAKALMVRALDGRCRGCGRRNPMATLVQSRYGGEGAVVRRIARRSIDERRRSGLSTTRRTATTLAVLALSAA